MKTVADQVSKHGRKRTSKKRKRPWQRKRTLRNVSVVVGLIFVIVALYTMQGGFLGSAQQIIQDAWVENPADPPKAYYQFTFVSVGAFTANYPIELSIKLWITKGLVDQLTPLAFVFPDALAYPQTPSLTHPAEAPTINVTFSLADGAYVGKGAIEFTAAGQFGYIIFCKGQPAYYTADRKTITVSPVEVREQLNNNQRNTGLTLLSIGITLIVGSPIVSIVLRTRTEKKDADIAVSFSIPTADALTNGMPTVLLDRRR